MTRLARMLYPLSLSALLAGAVAIACSHRGEAPATPRPEPISPSGMPMAGGARESSDPIDAGVDDMLANPPSAGGQPLSLLRGPGAPTLLLAAQPTSPSAPPPGAPSQPAPRSPSSPGSGSGSNAPGTSSPADAGTFDAGLPQLPPIPDGGIPSDSGMQPILRRD